jgi:hypothetical protein
MPKRKKSVSRKKTGGRSKQGVMSTTAKSKGGRSKTNSPSRACPRPQNNSALIKRDLAQVAKLKMFCDYLIFNDSEWTKEKSSYVEGINDLILGVTNVPVYIDVDPKLVEYQDGALKYETAVREYAEKHNMSEPWVQQELGRRDCVDWLLGKRDSMPTYSDALLSQYENAYAEHGWDGIKLEYEMRYGSIRGIEKHWSVEADFHDVYGDGANALFTKSAEARLAGNNNNGLSLISHLESNGQGWDIEYLGKETLSRDNYGLSTRLIDGMVMKNPAGNKIDLKYDNTDTHFELYGLFADQTGTGLGTQVLESIRDYVDKSNKGLVITYVSNHDFFGRFPWLKKRDPVIDPTDGLTFTDVGGWYEYVYGDVPNDAIDYSYILKVMEKEM